MTEPVVITVAITGAVPRKKDNPAVPVTPAEQIDSTHQAYEAGASLVHIHVRNQDESPGSDPASFAAVQEGVAKHCPGIIVQFSTGGRGRGLNERGGMLYLKPDMASLATGSVNFPTSVYTNPPEFVEDLARSMLDNDIKPEVEIFDLAMLYNAARLVDKGLLRPPAHVQFVLGIPNALPALGAAAAAAVSGAGRGGLAKISVPPGLSPIGRRAPDVGLLAPELVTERGQGVHS